MIKNRCPQAAAFSCPPRVASFASMLFTTLLLSVGAAAHAQSNSSEPVDPPTNILSESLTYDDANRKSLFKGNVVLTRGLMTLHADQVALSEDSAGKQVGVATANKGKMVTIRQERPETFEYIEGKGKRAEYASEKNEFDLIDQAVVIRYICGKPFDTIRGERIRYNQKTGTYQAFGGSNSSTSDGRVRSIVEPRAKADAAVAECRAKKGSPSPKKDG